MQIPAVKAEKRSASGTKAMRKLRAGGLVPGVLYGKGQENLNVQLAGKDLVGLIGGSQHVVQLDFGAETSYALLRAVDQDHLSDIINHVDFLRVDLADKVRVRVPVTFIGTAKGVAHGGVMEVLHGDIELMAPASAVPGTIEVEVGALEIGDAVRYKDLKLPEGVTAAVSPNIIVVHCTHPRKVEEVAPAPGEAAAAAAAGAAAPGASAAPGAAPAAAGAKGAAPAAAAKAAPAKK